MSHNPYPWKHRLDLLTSSSVLAMLFRPADWPFGPSLLESADGRRLLNVLSFLIATALTALLVDWLFHRWGCPRFLAPASDRSKPEGPDGKSPALSGSGTGPHPYWISCLAAVLVCGTVDLLASGREFSPDNAEILPLERAVCGVSLALLLAWPRWIGPALRTIRGKLVLLPPAPSSADKM